ncbi:MAG TPA: hypothetical protein VKS98_01225, partial [Chthoniobacterales bacterium]|nr:hypothetical protein [Chthoniobacterales bacterium]
QTHVGWGHGSLSAGINLAVDAGVRRLILFHHDPRHDDQAIDKMVEMARELASNTGKKLEVEGAREGAEITI